MPRSSWLYILAREVVTQGPPLRSSQGGSRFLLCSHLSIPPSVPFVGSRRRGVLAGRSSCRQPSRDGPPEAAGPDGCSRPAAPRLRGAAWTARSRSWRTSRSPLQFSLLSTDISKAPDAGAGIGRKNDPGDGLPVVLLRRTKVQWQGKTRPTGSRARIHTPIPREEAGRG